MRQKLRERRVWSVILAGAVVVAAVVVPLVVLGAKDDVSFTATAYSDVIRFEAEDAASLEVTIFDLSGKKLWASGVVSESFVDWDRTNSRGESLANGVYIYTVRAWDSRGAVLLAKRGKIALLPGEEIQLQAAPTTSSSGTSSAGRSTSSSSPSTTHAYGSMEYSNTGDFTITGSLGVGTDTPETAFHVSKNEQVQGLIAAFTTAVNNAAGLTFRRGRGTADSPSTVQAEDRLGFFLAAGYDGMEWVNSAGLTFKVDGTPSVGNVPVRIAFETNASGYPREERMVIKSEGNVGIGAASPAAQLDVRNSSDQPTLRLESSSGMNLIEAYNTGSLVFRVERATGDVRADGAFYGTSFNTGSADVAERINASEPLEPGDVVEIDPENCTQFRLSRSAGSRLVAGVISTKPGVVLGLNSDPVEGDTDPRPVLALAGRVPVKVTAENGAIRVGDLLIASSTPGHAMRCSDPVSAIGAVIAKALEPLKEDDGVIMAQVMLR